MNSTITVSANTLVTGNAATTPDAADRSSGQDDFSNVLQQVTPRTAEYGSGAPHTRRTGSPDHDEDNDAMGEEAGAKDQQTLLAMLGVVANAAAAESSGDAVVDSSQQVSDEALTLAALATTLNPAQTLQGVMRGDATAAAAALVPSAQRSTLAAGTLASSSAQAGKMGDTPALNSMPSQQDALDATPLMPLLSATDADAGIQSVTTALQSGTAAAVWQALTDGAASSSDRKAAETTTVNDSWLATMNTVMTQAAGTQQAEDVQATAQQVSLHSRVGSEHWPAELGNKLVVLAREETSSAILNLSPDHLGPVQVRIETSHDQANVWFTASHHETRSALEQSLPRLRELFAAQGMNLQDAGVFGDSARQQAAQEQSRQATTWSVSDNSLPMDDESRADTAKVRVLNLALVDAYA